MILPRTGDRNEATSKGEYDSIAVDKMFDYDEDADILTKGFKEIGDMSLGSILRGYNAGSDFVMGDLLGNPEYQRDWSMDDDFFDALGLLPAGMSTKRGVKLGKKGLDHVAPLLKGKAPKGSLGRSLGKVNVLPNKKQLAGTAVVVPTVGAMSDGNDSISQEEGSPAKTAFSEIKDIIGGNKEQPKEAVDAGANVAGLQNAMGAAQNNFDRPDVDDSITRSPQKDLRIMQGQLKEYQDLARRTPGGLSFSDKAAMSDIRQKLYKAEKANKRGLEEDEIISARGIPAFDEAGKPIPFEKRKQMVRDQVQSRGRTPKQVQAPKQAPSMSEPSATVSTPKVNPFDLYGTPTVTPKVNPFDLYGPDSIERRVPDGKGGYSQRDPKLPAVTKSSVDVRDNVEGRIPDGEGGYSQPDPLLERTVRDPITDTDRDSRYKLPVYGFQQDREQARANWEARVNRQPTPLSQPQPSGPMPDPVGDADRDSRYKLPVYTQMGARNPNIARSDWQNRINNRAKEAEDKRKTKRMGKGTATLYDPSLF